MGCRSTDGRTSMVWLDLCDRVDTKFTLEYKNHLVTNVLKDSAKCVWGVCGGAVVPP
jgi:hypothetical protein